LSSERFSNMSTTSLSKRETASSSSSIASLVVSMPLPEMHDDSSVAPAAAADAFRNWRRGGTPAESAVGIASWSGVPGFVIGMYHARGVGDKGATSRSCGQPVLRPADQRERESRSPGIPAIIQRRSTVATPTGTCGNEGFPLTIHIQKDVSGRVKEPKRVPAPAVPIDVEGCTGRKWNSERHWRLAMARRCLWRSGHRDRAAYRRGIAALPPMGSSLMNVVVAFDESHGDRE
jgi:hypothetical protein